jgi:adenylylsulfate kinase-like enzyme
VAPVVPAYVISGIPGAGKTTVAHLLAQRFERGVHVEPDVLQGMIVRGGLWPDQEPHDEAMRQLELRARNAALLARSFRDAGFTPVVDDVVVVPARLAIYEDALGDDLEFVVLAPTVAVALERDATRGYKTTGGRWAHLDATQRTELRDAGRWIDNGDQTPEQTVDAILKPPAG